ncbi:MAG TPA: tRNA pseudouridine(55) synthase TruB [Persephonella sp.]|uniref:tRNA pseudouridine synthase B n=1 Tax=Persephonella marina (strain DSM 14350 / EX-H1) TaxID=123214 RepID=C0QUQ5_PERMH|nr:MULTISPECIES: tRNA pseudouridine(55) synthase TruB [Persephonella]ACO03605.1 tRNA pseudouridine synthase B [Persephonella marina EX-H1]HCB69964.1 tRNA pseudouridine(55) synthase TruB [Persephonella sp.]
MDGILLVDKPENITSNHLVQKIKKHFKQITGKEIKVGHTGTLDYFASGLMVITVGKATRLTEYFQGLDKEYIATGELGKITDTYDRQGRVIEEKECKIDEDQLKDIILSFKKRYLQTPPPYSSKRIEGKRAYQLAKKGIQVKLKPKEVTIYSIQILKIEMPFFTIKVHCSSGTYIRSLVKEIGDKAGCGAYVKSLRRTKVGIFSVENAIKLEELLRMTEQDIESRLIDIKDALYFFTEILLDPVFDERFIKGQRFKVPYSIKGLVKVLDKNKRFLGIGEIKENQILQPVKVFI